MLRFDRILAFICAASLGTSLTAQTFQAGVENEVAVEGYNNEPINIYSKTADFRKLGLGVGKLNVSHDKGNNPCTAFLVSPTHILTNHHCIPGVLEDPRIGATQILSASFLAGFDEPGRADEADHFPVNITPVETSKELDYTVLEVTGVPIDRFPPLPLTDQMPTEGLPYWIIGHPLGKSLHISREGCRAARPPVEGNRLRHTCDTLGGNSGSPIIDSSTRQVIGLHNSGDRNVGINFGIPMKLILENSSVLKVTKAEPPKPLPMITRVFPSSAGVGGELSIVGDVPSSCTPAFVDISKSLDLTPIPLEIFEQVVLGPLQTRYQITVTSDYRIFVQEEDEKGEHKLGTLCGSTDLTDPEQLRAALRGVVGALQQGRLDGQVNVAGGTVDFAFTTYMIE
ncbi:trypsin-like peptidase domain-containing protein [Antarctobacter jejuensis]|uniref:trypsin-like peptidase domain-containing protein n=1 Tax=Antarctobacter jejuensis TaxID=1439938 RepID=UPI003FD022D9